MTVGEHLRSRLESRWERRHLLDASQVQVVAEPALIIRWHDSLVGQVLGVFEQDIHRLLLQSLLKRLRIGHREPASWLRDVILSGTAG